MGYERGLLLAIYSFHKQNSADDARQYLQDLVSRNHFRNAVRVNQIEAMLDLYLTWAAASHVVTAATKTRILLQVGGYLEMTGEVSRVDVVQNGYRAILLKNPPPDWDGQMRMPLLQDVVASKFNRPVAEVEVGFQNLDGSGLATVRFDSVQIQQARREFQRLASAFGGSPGIPSGHPHRNANILRPVHQAASTTSVRRTCPNVLDREAGLRISSDAGFCRVANGAISNGLAASRHGPEHVGYAGRAVKGTARWKNRPQLRSAG